MTGPVASARLEGDAVLEHPLVQELLASPVVCVLATLDPERVIHAVPMWFARDDDAIVLATGRKSRKVGNLGRDPRATLVVHDSRPGFEVCGVALEGRAEVVRGPDAAAAIELVHRRYVARGAETNEHVREFLDSDDVALRFVPESAWVWDHRGSPASEELRRLGGALPLLSTEPRE